MSSPGSSMPRLGPTWNQGGRGFQPPPAVRAERMTQRGRSGSTGSKEEPPKRDVNKFAALDEDDDDVDVPAANTRVDALRSQRSPPSGKSGGRSLADLAASVPAASLGRSHSSGVSGKEEGGRFSGLRSSSESAPPTKVIRFTREKLLSKRPVPDENAEYPPSHLKALEGTVILSKEAQDPVCWDTFDPDAIWAVAARERMPRSSSTGSKGAEVVKPRRASTDTGAGRWQRGVALPPPDESQTRSRRDRDAENPDELWDDPLESKDAAADFSAFGGMPEDPKNDTFDLNDMAEATRQFEMERHGSKGSDLASEGDGTELPVQAHNVDPKRPLASIGTTIQSGSGENVNVFEDFGAPATDGEAGPISKGGDVDASASSRLMKMIGVSNEAEPVPGKQPATELPGWGAGVSERKPDNNNALAPGTSLSMNPWGGSMLAPTGIHKGEDDLGARLQAMALQKLRGESSEIERREVQETEMNRRRQEEEAQRRSMLAQKQTDSFGTPQQQQQHSQVELVLIERISSILEKTWGRSDLGSILATLHAEDSRVIPLLGNVDALRALIARHPKRIQLRNDPAFGAEMATLLLSHTQWQQQEAHGRAEQEEMERREQQRRMQEAASRETPQMPPIAPDAPWFYSDPQKNVQGPFRGDEMRQWLEAGYFKGDLPISQQPTGPFVPLSTLFPDLSVAFKFENERNRAAEAAAAAAAAEQERLMVEQRAKAEAREAEAEARAQAAAAKEAKQNQSSQLKMMLGMGGSDGPVPADQPTEKTPKKSRPQDKKAAKANEKGTVKVQQRAAPIPQEGSPSDQNKSTGPAWGGASPSVPRKSMSEIQHEEARAAARLAMERKNNPRSSSSGWANVAASGGGSSGWSSGAVRPTPAASITNVHAGAPATQVAQPRPLQVPQSENRQSSAPKPQRQKSSAPASDDFGASMPPALQSWCKDQMRKLNGSEDLTLVSFCMTLSDPDEIRQYLTAYLGSTPQVNNFAAEFIKRKNGKDQQDEWETPAVSKKSKKKKGGR